MNTRILTISMIVGSAILIAGYLMFAHSRHHEPIVVGFVASFSGKYADLGAKSRDGAMLALEEINTAGGIKGHPLQLRIRDDRGISAIDPDILTEFVTNQIQFIIGPTTKDKPINSPNRSAQQELLIAPNSDCPNPDDPKHPTICLSPSAREIGERLGAEAMRRKLHKVVSIIDESDREYGESITTGIATALAAKAAQFQIDMVRFHSESDLSTIETVEHIIAFHPDAVVISLSSIDTAIVAQRLRAKIPALFLFSSPRAATKDLIRNGGKAIEGLTLALPYDMNSTQAEFADFQINYERRFGEKASFISSLNTRIRLSPDNSIVGFAASQQI